MSRYICSFLVLSLISLNIWAQAGSKAPRDSIVYHGTQLGISLVEPIRSLFSPDRGAALQVDVNLLNRFFPLIELGYAQSKLQNDLQTSLETQGLFVKAGINLALAKEGLHAENLFFVGGRIAYSPFAYNISGGRFDAGYWNEAYLRDFNKERTDAVWVEMLAGLRVQLIGPISMGWSGKIKTTLKVWNGAHSIPAYIPGYGKNQTPMYDLSLHLYYRLPHLGKKNLPN